MITVSHVGESQGIGSAAVVLPILPLVGERRTHEILNLLASNLLRLPKTLCQRSDHGLVRLSFHVETHPKQPRLVFSRQREEVQRVRPFIGIVTEDAQAITP